MNSMAYRIVDLEIARPLADVELAPGEEGFALIARWHGRIIGFVMKRKPRAYGISEAELRELIERDFGVRILAVELERVLNEHWPRPTQSRPPSLTIAVCTKDRAVRLKRLLTSLDVVRSDSPFRSLEVIVVDNASVDPETREVARSFQGVRYLSEPKTGLDFARNAAISAATGDLVAYLDDDVVVDRNWLSGLYEAWADCPDAGGYSGLVLPYRLDTPAQIRFERQGGFGRGFDRLYHGNRKSGNPLHPVGAGVVGAGANMCFRRELLVRLGGFDEALDTGAPLPGGGDLDIFYRVIRAGYIIVYEPRYAVYHEHRETLKQLRRQYWSWGLGFMAFLDKSRRTDPDLGERQRAMMKWWFRDKVIALFGGLFSLNIRRTGDVAAELVGGLQGIFGEYDRSLKRSQRIRDRIQ
jgi:glycosyltransferase involved in cell wall biosynthesis